MKTATKERPILFSAPMVCAILDGRKSQTRRIIKRPEYYTKIRECAFCCPYGVEAERLWVRETWSDYRDDTPDEQDAKATAAGAVKTLEDMVEFAKLPGGGGERKFLYAADFGSDMETLRSIGPWKPSIHMPRIASRLTLEITDVRVERLQEISESDAQAEGVTCDRYKSGYEPGTTQRPRQAFIELWNTINGPDSWEANPWVWAISFKRVGV